LIERATARSAGAVLIGGTAVGPTGRAGNAAQQYRAEPLIDRHCTHCRYLVIVVTMTTMSLADAKAHLSKLVAQVSGHHDHVYVTVHGKPSAVLVATEDLESLEETIEILADADTMRRLHRSEAELACGEVESRADLDAAMRQRRAAQT
jgi:antitoxin YefM